MSRTRILGGFEYRFTWASQVRQYPERGRGNAIELFEGKEGDTLIAHCLLKRDSHGRIEGILNHYPNKTHFEKPGNVTIFVKPTRQRRGIAEQLLLDAMSRWPINFIQQSYTTSGLRFIERFLERHPELGVSLDDLRKGGEQDARLPTRLS
jgi:hypothetical protein